MPENKIQIFIKTKKRRPIFEIRFSNKSKSENEIQSFMNLRKNKKRNRHFSKKDRRFQNFKNRFEFSDNNTKSTYWKNNDFDNPEDF